MTDLDAQIRAKTAELLAVSEALASLYDERDKVMADALGAARFDIILYRERLRQLGVELPPE